MLCDRETRSAIQYSSASGEVTRDIQNAEFWRDRLELDTDADGVDHLRVNYPVYVHEDWPLLYGGSMDFVVGRLNVERWEGLYPALAAPPPSKEPVENYKRYTRDDALVEEAIEGLKSKKYPNKWRAAQALAARAEGSSHSSTVDRLRKKIGAALED